MSGTAPAGGGRGRGSPEGDVAGPRAQVRKREMQVVVMRDSQLDAADAARDAKDAARDGRLRRRGE